jgi:hypothetical protein
MPIQVMKQGRMPSNSLVALIDTTIVQVVLHISIKDPPNVGEYTALPT